MLFYKILKNDQKKIYLINNKYILKKDLKEKLLAENIFLSLYTKKEVERVIFYRKNSNYAIYEYQKENMLDIKSKEHVLHYINQIKKFIDNYVEAKCYGYGDIFDRVDSWKAFLEKEIYEKSKFMEFEKYETIKKSLNIIEQYKFKKKIIHGDLGIYNVIFQKDKIKIVIDPRTIIGDPLYDFIYFVLSKLDFIENINIDDIINITSQPRQKVIELMKILLYIRMSINKKNGLQVNKYEEVWNELINISNNKILYNKE